MLKRVFGGCLLSLLLATSCAWAQVEQYQRWSIPESARPNQETLEFYLQRYLRDANKHAQHAAAGSDTPSKFKRDIRDEPRVSAAMKDTALLSYLLYENGSVTVDALNPRFAHLVNNQTRFYSMSMGKSMTAYVLAHAVCQRMITDLDQQLSDWPLVQDTMYQHARLVDLVNMRAGDQHTTSERQGLAQTGRNPNNTTIRSLVERELKNTTPASAQFNYNSVSPNMVLNYVIYKSNGEFDQLMRKIFQEKIRTAHSVFFLKQAQGKEEDGLARATFYASRYDYLRIAQAMLNDWQNDTCEGRFLKDVYKRRHIKQGEQMNHATPGGSFWAFRGYGGFFHTDFYTISKNRNIMAMLGYGGQMIVIDFDQGRIVATHAVHNDYDWKALVNDVIDLGKFKKRFWD